jgi:hypothetical protein
VDPVAVQLVDRLAVQAPLECRAGRQAQVRARPRRVCRAPQAPMLVAASTASRALAARPVRLRMGQTIAPHDRDLPADNEKSPAMSRAVRSTTQRGFRRVRPMNVRMTVYLRGLLSLLALGISRAVMPHDATQEKTSAPVSKAEGKEGSDLKTITELDPKCGPSGDSRATTSVTEHCRERVPLSSSEQTGSANTISFANAPTGKRRDRSVPAKPPTAPSAGTDSFPPVHAGFFATYFSRQ